MHQEGGEAAKSLQSTLAMQKSLQDLRVRAGSPQGLLLDRQNLA